MTVGLLLLAALLIVCDGARLKRAIQKWTVSSYRTMVPPLLLKVSVCHSSIAITIKQSLHPTCRPSIRSLSWFHGICQDVFSRNQHQRRAEAGIMIFVPDYQAKLNSKQQN